MPTAPTTRYLLAVIFFAICTIALTQQTAHAGDGIPDNCETASGDRINLFARYEPHNRRLMLVHWATGADVQVIASDLTTAINPTWSPDCRYLAVAVASGTGYDTVVYDVDGGGYVGRVADAQGKPHPLTWGPPPYLMVETRQGALLWNVRDNTQMHLTESYNRTTGRNFSRIRWDSANQQVSVNLAVGGREVYDLTTGQLIPQAANVTDSIPAARGYKGDVIIGGKAYECQGMTSFGYRNWGGADGIPAVQVDFNPSSQTLFIRLRNHSSRIEALQMVEENVGASWFRFIGWSASCRYFAAHLGVPGQRASDTVVWDIIENRRVGAIADARLIRHPVSRSNFDDALFVQTRRGGYLWHLPTNTQRIITDAVEIPVSGHSYVRNVASSRWEAGRLLIEPLNAHGTWTVYDVTNGQQIAEGIPHTPYVYQPPNPTQTYVPPTPVDGQNGYSAAANWWGSESRTIRGECAQQRLRYQTQERALIITDRNGAYIQTIEEGLNPSRAIWSPDCRWVYAIVDAVTNERQPYDNKPLDDIGRDRRSKTLIIWDTSAWERRFVLEHPYDYGITATIRWSPGVDRAIAYTSNGSYLLNLYTGENVLLVFSQGAANIFEPGRTMIYWDYARGQVLINGAGQVFAFDMHTGVERYRFAGGRDYWYSRFTVHDNKMLFIMGTWSGSVWVWDMDSLEYRVAALGKYTEAAFGGSRIALSADGRYLAMGYTRVRVWDLSKQTASPVLRAVAQKPDAYYVVPGVYQDWRDPNSISAIRFIDATTLHVTTQQGTTMLLDITTGSVTALSQSEVHRHQLLDNPGHRR